VDEKLVFFQRVGSLGALLPESCPLCRSVTRSVPVA